VSDALERLAAVFRTPPAVRFSDWFVNYHADLYVHGVPFEVYVEKVRAIRRALDDAPRVLDVGAGFGVYASLLRILGTPEVVALDYHRQKTLDARALAAHLGLDGLRVLQGDATALPFADGTFDGALTLASLSHIRDADRALASIHRVLKPGGRLFVFEDNNSSYPGYAREMAKVWDGAETGTYADGVPGEKQRAESYVEMRRAMIRERFPDLPEAELDACARETRGLWGRGILEAVEARRRDPRWTNPRRHLVCHPASGEYEEYPLNPAIVRGLLEKAGFDTALRSPHAGPFRGRGRFLKRLAAGVFRLCPSLLTWMSPTFAVVATKR
jgi:SAM-dependent methyltransferase